MLSVNAMSFILIEALKLIKLSVIIMGVIVL
jgi:hypothetical protein